MLTASLDHPIFCPDATRGVLRSLDSQDIIATRTQAMIVNTLHLMQKPGPDFLQQVGGLKKFMNWPGTLISDSGGFQIFSLFHSDPERGKITDAGLKIYTGPKKQHFELFSPEKSIQVQFAIGSDVKVCLDDFTPIAATQSGVEASVRRTILWAERSKQEFERLLRKMPTATQPPQLFAVIQGHQDRHWRRYCADALLEIGFAGYGLGGWLYHPDGTIDYDTMRFNASLTPPEFHRYAMGFGKPEDIVQIYQMGYDIFDVVLPTRDARHGRLYVFLPEFRALLAQHQANPDDHKTSQQITQRLQRNQFYRFLYLDKSEWLGSAPGSASTPSSSSTSASPHQPTLTPPDPACQCHTCQNYSTAYLHHLLKIPDTTSARLATIHNVFFYQELMELLSQFLRPTA